MAIFKINSQNSSLSPSYFTQDVIPLEVKEFNRSIAEQMNKLPSLLDLTPQEIRTRDQNWATEKSSILSA